MKFFYILLKNFKAVSRSWSHIILLVICPIALIFLAGLMLNSSSISNLEIGMVKSLDSEELDLDAFKDNYIYYNTLENCIHSLNNSRIDVCIQIKKNANSKEVLVIIDNRKRAIHSYVKQYLLSEILREQSQIIEQTSSEIGSRLTFFSTSIENSKKELEITHKELEEQERLLIQYQKNLTKIKSEFDEIFQGLKNIQSDIKNKYLPTIHQTQNNLIKLQSSTDELKNSLNEIDEILSDNLGPEEYASTSPIIKETISNLDNLEENFDELNSELTQIEENLETLNATIQKLEEARNALDEVEIEIQNAIDKTRKGKERIREFQKILEEADQEITEIHASTEDSPASVIFADAFQTTNNPIYNTFPFLTSILITFTSIVLSNLFIIRQTTKKSHVRELISPTSDAQFLIADYLTNLVLILIQVLTLFAIGSLWVNISFTQNATPIILTILLTSSIFILIGMSIGYLFRTPTLSMLVSIFAVMILFIMSDILTPAPLIGNFVKYLININIFMVLNNLLSDLILFDADPLKLKLTLITLSIVFVILFFFAFTCKKISKKKILQQNI